MLPEPDDIEITVDKDGTMRQVLRAGDVTVEIETVPMVDPWAPQE